MNKATDEKVTGPFPERVPTPPELADTHVDMPFGITFIGVAFIGRVFIDADGESGWCGNNTSLNPHISSLRGSYPTLG